MEIGLALSGGAARGIAHIGVLKYLEERNVKPDIVSGTSAGSIIGGLFCAGFSPDDIEELAHNVSWRQIFRYSRIKFPRLGLIDIGFLDKVMGDYLKDKKFSDLKTPFIATAVDLENQCPLFIEEGDLMSAIRGSCAIPGIFSPVQRTGNTLVDGGVLHNIPTPPLQQKGTKMIIAVDVNAHRSPERSPRHIFEVISQSLYMINRYRENEDASLAAHLIVPDLQNIGMWDLNKTSELIDLGYKKAQEVLAEVDFSPPTPTPKRRWPWAKK